MFGTIEYAYFFGIAFVAVWTLRNYKAAGAFVLTTISIAFFCYANIRSLIFSGSLITVKAIEIIITCLGLLIFTSFLDFKIASKIALTANPSTARSLLAFSVGINLSILGFFKYFNFFSVHIAEILNFDAWQLNLVCPMGISFYTFQTISYVTDVYRKKTNLALRYRDYLLYLAFFPQLLMGPIIRASDLMLKLAAPPKISAEEGSRAVARIGIGLVKKLLIADFLRVHAVDPVFSNPNMYSSVEILFAVYSYSFQIYADFSAYTDIAIGSASLLGIKIPENFRAPYLAASLRDFWHRWHITLSLWLRDYLYIPLGGSKRPAIFVYFNLLITMILGGLWHGASANYLIWGAFHGLILVINRAVSKTGFGDFFPKTFKSVAGVFLTFNLVSAAWVFFRAPTFLTASDIFVGLAAADLGVANISTQAAIVLFIAAIMHCIPENIFNKLIEYFHRLPAPVQALLFVAAIYIAKRYSTAQVSPFIYSQY